MNPLNPDLYQALLRVFGDVAISSEGSRANITRTPKRDRNGRPHLSVKISGGEYYRVNCPYCNDTRKRLYIGYLWGQLDKITGREILHNVICYNEKCIRDRIQQQSLFDRVYPFGGAPRLSLPPVSRGNGGDSHPSSSEAIAAKLPDNTVPLTDRSVPDHVRKYLLSRHFDSVLLWKRWKVRYCAAAIHSTPIIHDRIVIPFHVFNPIRKKLLLAGWQARSLNDDESAPKYLFPTGMRKSRLVYDLFAARRSRGPVVICEGVTDVWRLNKNAVALLGKTMSERQCDLIVSEFTGRPLVVLLDADARNEALKIARQLRSRRHEHNDSGVVVVATLPRNAGDPADCTRTQVWKAIATALGLDAKRLVRKVFGPPRTSRNGAPASPSKGLIS